MNRNPQDLMKTFFTTSAKEPRIITIPPLNFLMIDGHGDPNTNPSYPTAVSALYTLSYTLKFDLKKEGYPEFKVFPLEGLWWAEDLNTFQTGEKSAWDWTMLIAQPDWITREQIDQAITKTASNGKVQEDVLGKVRFELYDEGLSVQMMHIGPYSTEGPNIARMHAFVMDKGYELRGKHHEIYLGDPNRTAPEKLKTIIRQPIQKP